MTILVITLSCLYIAIKLFNLNIEKTESGWYLFYGNEHRNWTKLWD
jgi:hypothetical protein